MKNLLLLNHPQHKTAPELLTTLGQKIRIQFCLWLLAGLLLLGPRLLQAQTYDGNINLRSQAEVNAFNFTEVTVNLTIQGTDITDLRPLATLTRVGGNLNIYYNSNLSSLEGLENLTSVGSRLDIYQNNLSSLKGLENLTSVGENLYIDNNTKLTSLESLKNLASVGKNFRIYQNNSLSTLAGLENLTSVGGFFNIQTNTNLTSLSGLNHLTLVGGYLDISYNNNLSSVTGLKNLTSVKGNLLILYNPQLSQCCQFLSVIKATKGSINISGNAANCSSPADIEASCAPVITAQPESAEVCAGQTVTFTVEATGSGLAYQWQKNGKDIAGATASSYPIAAVQDLDADTYTVIVYNANTTVKSQEATLTVNPGPTPVIVAKPTSSVYTGGNPNVIYIGYGPQSVKLLASGGVSYSWSPATGLSNATIAEPIFTPTQVGTYPFTVTVTNSSGCQATASVTITVIDVRSGKNLDKVMVCHGGQKLDVLSINPTSVQDHLAHGDKLGDCSGAAPARMSSQSNPLEAEVAPKLMLTNYPNPFSGHTTIAFTFEQEQDYTLGIYDMSGKPVTQLSSGKAKAGELVQIAWQAGKHPKGMYLARLRSANGVQHIKLMSE